MSTASDLLPDKCFLGNNQKQENISIDVENITKTFKVMSSFRESNIFCDILLTTDDGKEISAHKVVLGSASTVLLSMFMDAKEKNDFVVPIKDIDGDILEIIVKYMYTFKLDLNFNDKNIEKILRAANFFDLNNVKNLCCDFIENNINLENCLYFMKCAELFSFKRLYDLSFAYTLKHFLKMKTSILNHLACENIIMFISSNNLETESEEQVYNLILEWVQFDFENRKEFIPELMKHIRWPFLSTDFLFKALNEPLIKTHNECLFLLVEATMIHCAYSKLSPLTLNSFSTRSKRRLPLINKFDVIVSVYHDKDDKYVSYLDISDPNSEWEDVPINLIPPNMYSRIIALDNGILMSIGGKKNNKDVTNDVFMLDTSNYWLNWIEIAPTNFKRTDFAVCSDQKCVYVIGGINDNRETLDSIEYFDVDTKQWNLLGNLKTPRSHCSAICHKKIIYIIGGRDADAEFSTLVECYDISIHNWVEICHPLPKPLKRTSVTILNNVLYVIGRNFNAKSGNYCLDTVLYSFDLQNGEWECLTLMQSDQKGADVAMVNGKQLYIVDGYILDYDKIVRNCHHHKESLDQMLFSNVVTTEIYGVENNKWYVHQLSDDDPRASNLFLWSKNLVSVLLIQSSE